MLKWLTIYRQNAQRKIITDDPLATISVHPKSHEIYAVSRINPLYVDDNNSNAKNVYRESGIAHLKCSVYENRKSLEDAKKKSPEESAKRRLPLNTIKEEQIDQTITNLVWPNWERANDSCAVYNSLRFDPNSRIHRKAQRPSCVPVSSGEIPTCRSTLELLKALTVQIEGNVDNDKTLMNFEAWLDETRRESSSSVSSSGFSELTTPASSSSSAVYEPLSQLSCSNNIFFGTFRSTSNLYGGHVSTDVYADKCKEDLFKNHAGQRLDFTLDNDQAEKLIKKLKTRKQQRCACRIIITFLSFIVFVLCVVIFSLIITNGKRIFGSL